MCASVACATHRVLDVASLEREFAAPCFLPVKHVCINATSFEICVCRCNVSVDQRRDFVAVASEFGAPTHTVVLDLPFKVCVCMGVCVLTLAFVALASAFGAPTHTVVLDLPFEVCVCKGVS